MSLITYPKPDELDESTAKILENIPSESGEIPTFNLILANNPAILGPAAGLLGASIYGGNLDPALKQLAFVAVSHENQCAYCAASHGAELVNALGLPVRHLDSLAQEDYEEFTDRQRTVTEFARQAANDPKRISEEDLAELEAVGFDDSDVIELLAVIGLAQFGNTIADTLNLRPADDTPELEQYYSRAAPAED